MIKTTNSAGKGKAYVSTSLKKEIVELIDERATQLGVKRGSVLRQILEKWYHEGCRPINPADEALQHMQTLPHSAKKLVDRLQQMDEITGAPIIDTNSPTSAKALNSLRAKKGKKQA